MQVSRWRVGSQVPINVYDGDRPVCQCHTAIDAKRIVSAVNGTAELLRQAADIAERYAMGGTNVREEILALAEKTR